jgi:hypothetical protein
MRVRRITSSVAVASILLLAGFQRGGPKTISGIVVDAGGAAVTAAVVAAVPADEGGSVANLSWIGVDSQGRFRLILRPGVYTLRAKDENGGYPDPSFLLCSDPKAVFPQVSVGQADLSGLRLILGQKGGIITGDLLNEITQQPVANGKITIRDARRHDAFVELSASANGRFRFTVPNKPVQIVATAPGYRDTYYDNGGELLLSGGEAKDLVIKLTPH